MPVVDSIRYGTDQGGAASAVFKRGSCRCEPRWPTSAVARCRGIGYCEHGPDGTGYGSSDDESYHRGARVSVGELIKSF